jgi:hypothetical protein
VNEHQFRFINLQRIQKVWQKFRPGIVEFNDIVDSIHGVWSFFSSRSNALRDAKTVSNLGVQLAQRRRKGRVIVSGGG